MKIIEWEYSFKIGCSHFFIVPIDEGVRLEGVSKGAKYDLLSFKSRVSD